MVHIHQAEITTRNDLMSSPTRTTIRDRTCNAARATHPAELLGIRGLHVPALVKRLVPRMDGPVAFMLALQIGQHLQVLLSLATIGV